MMACEELSTLYLRPSDLGRLSFRAKSKPMEGLLAAYPSIERDDVLACIAYGLMEVGS